MVIKDYKGKKDQKGRKDKKDYKDKKDLKEILDKMEKTLRVFLVPKEIKEIKVNKD
eukprot:CAMPEP_0117059804 /NCGR_PEP_ID=MMETSP0472-20121206/41574_1 /TAXON_ID=693140 ORGANISM="Tiarina fusus, Strain LIS" /NCGR_SAMPLE_ID=MMETSP0472 /ASSEMBLY_ACC=CAM_ASM_000603 /LENGTH=55 /DNA_ID=CAMNT_0004777719 /DNA_START=168 /DNA_END=335 /DNA_ORIENTATION=+